MKRLICKEKNKSIKLKAEKNKIYEIQEAIDYAKDFTINFQNIYNQMELRLPVVKVLLDVQAIQIYQIMLEKLKRSLKAFNKTTITDKLNLIVQQMSKKSENSHSFKKYSQSTNYHKSIVLQASQLKKELLYISEELEKLYKQGEVLAEKTKHLLNYHSKNSVLKRIKNIKTVIRWIKNEDGFDTDIIGRLNKIIYVNIPSL